MTYNARSPHVLHQIQIALCNIRVTVIARDDQVRSCLLAKVFLGGQKLKSCSIGCLINDFCDNDIGFTCVCHHFKSPLSYAICLLTTFWCYQLVPDPWILSNSLENDWHSLVTSVVAKELAAKKVCSDLAVIQLFK